MVYLLNDDYVAFPPPTDVEPDGFLAVGGKLTPEWLLTAYCQGIFPWFSFKDCDKPHWFCPQDRFVIFPEEIHISHSMRQLINKGEYHMTVNRAFGRVIQRCSEVNGRLDQDGAWLGPDIIEAYTKLHDMGFASSVEIWKGEELVGGLYGVTLGKCFFGESMFSDVPNGSKLALISLALHMEVKGWRMIDCQFETPHLKQMGADISVTKSI